MVYFGDMVVVVDNFVLVVELDFVFGGKWLVYSFDSLLNIKYGCVL